jgi:hypothetical protein
MKKLYFLFFFIAHLFMLGQSQNLADLAKGDYIGFNALFDQQQNLFGYFTLFGYGNSGDKTKKFEYVILDKNLNPIANKEFEGDITAKNYYGFMDFRGKIVLQPSEIDRFAVKNKDFFIPRSKIINLKENSISNKVYYDYKEGNFTELAEPKNFKASEKEDREEKKLKGYNYMSFVYEIKEGGSLVLEFNNYGNYINNNNLIKFDDNKKEIWRYRYNTSGDKKINEQLNVLEKDENYIYALLQNNNKKEKTFQLLILDMKTGKEIHKKEITGLGKNTMDAINSLNSYSFGRISNDKTFDDKIVILGRSYEDTGYLSTGFSRLMIDRKTFAVDTKEITYESLKPLIKNLSNNGYVEKGYFLDPRDAYFMKDGSIGILMEKYKAEGEYSAPKTTDLVYLFTDKDFKVSGVKIFEKEKTKWENSDYLFSQYLNNGEDVVFFYRDFQKDANTKEKNWNLYINTLIEGKFKQEMVPISAKEDFFVYPYVGKEGYILLREINEKEKFNKIRLERLNY